MSTKVTPAPLHSDVDASPSKLDDGEAPRVRKDARASRVFRAVNDVYEFEGWPRLWLNVSWLVILFIVLFYTYPSESGAYHAKFMSIMTSYEPSPGANNADVRTAASFGDGLSHALGFVTAYVNKAIADGQPEGLVPVTEYDHIMFARLEVDFASNCNPALRPFGFACYTTGADPTTGAQIDPAVLAALSGPDGSRQVVLFDRNMTRDETLARVAHVLEEELTFMSTYAYEAVLRLGVVNSIKPYYRTCYTFSINRKDRTTSVAAFREVIVSIDNIPVRSLPLYITTEDRTRAVLEGLSLLLLAWAIWGEIVQFNVCRVWAEQHLSEDELSGGKAAWRRHLHIAWLYFAQPWNVLDVASLVNYSVWWIAYIIIVIRSYGFKTKSVESLADYDAMRPFADSRFFHIIWGIFSSVLIGLRVLPCGKTHSGLRIYLRTLKQTWAYLKDMVAFFAYVAILVAALLAPLFAVTGANPSFKDGSTALLNIGLLAFGFFGYQDYFANDAPTFGGYKTIFMLVYWFVVIILFVISQNVLLALVASAYDEAREAEGSVERSYLALCAYRLCWMVYSRWHCWVLRKSRYALLEELLVTVRKPDAWWYEHAFVRWAISTLPEARLLAQLYTDPAAEVVYLYSPWAWSRASPWDTAQLAPWDEQLSYPMYTWADVPRNSPGARPRLLRLPPLFTGMEGAAAMSRMPVVYSEADDVFALAEDEVDDLLDCVDACWQRMRRNGVVARFSGMGWSERGRALLREGLLEVYRRHRVDERTSSSVQGPARTAAAGRAAQQPSKGGDGPATAHIKSLAALGDRLGSANRGAMAHGPAAFSGLLLTNDPQYGGLDAGSAGPGASPSAGGAAHQQRGRQLLFFNHRGRVADSLDLLWTEMSELRQQQDEIKALLRLLLLQQQRQQQQQPQQEYPKEHHEANVCFVVGARNAAADGLADSARGRQQQPR